MSERSELIGYLNPGLTLPGPLVGIIHRGGQFLMVYPDCSVEVLPIHNKRSAVDDGLVLFKPEHRIPFTENDFLYGITEEHILIGNQREVLRNLRLYLATSTDEGKDETTQRSINAFISNCENPGKIPFGHTIKEVDGKRIEIPLI